MRRTVGPGGHIQARSDSSWTVPEPELGVVLGEGGRPVAGTAGKYAEAKDGGTP